MFSSPRSQAACLGIGLSLFSWLGMQIIHEAGHVVGAWLTGGQVQRVVLDPLNISRTDVQPNPYPVIVLWLGPILGAAVPVGCWLILRKRRARSGDLVRFFAGFCLIANGTYIGSGAWDPVGDAADLLHNGARPAVLILFGLFTVPLGIWLWDGLGPRVGLQSPAVRPHRGELIFVWGMVVLIVAVEIIAKWL